MTLLPTTQRARRFAGPSTVASASTPGLWEVGVVLLLHVRQRQTQLRAVDAAALVWGPRHGARRLAEPNQVEQVLPFEKQLAPPLVEQRVRRRRGVGAGDRAL